MENVEWSAEKFGLEHHFGHAIHFIFIPAIADGAGGALWIALAYIVQVQAAAAYVRFSDRLFGRPAASDAC